MNHFSTKYPDKAPCVLKIITLKKSPCSKTFLTNEYKFITKYGSACTLSFQLGVGARIEE